VVEVLETLLDLLKLVRDEAVVVVVLYVDDKLLDARHRRVSEGHKVLDFDRSLYLLVLDIVSVKVRYHQIALLFHVKTVELYHRARELYLFALSALYHVSYLRHVCKSAVVLKCCT
jgi:hypothetical protein